MFPVPDPSSLFCFTEGITKSDEISPSHQLETAPRRLAGLFGGIHRPGCEEGKVAPQIHGLAHQHSATKDFGGMIVGERYIEFDGLQCAAERPDVLVTLDEFDLLQLGAIRE